MAEHETPRSELLLQLICEELLCSRIDRNIEELYKEVRESKERGDADLSDALLSRANIYRYALSRFEQRVDKSRSALELPSFEDEVSIALEKVKAK